MTEWRLDQTRFFVSLKAWRTVPRFLRNSFAVTQAPRVATGDGFIACIFLFASEVLSEEAEGSSSLFEGADSRYAILLDGVPTPEILRIPSILNLHRPEQRAHLTEDVAVVRRGAVSLLRKDPTEGILDAWVFEDELTLLLADLGKRTVDPSRVPSLRRMKPRDLGEFVIDEDGTYMHWPGPDVHLGVSQILQAVDPEYLAQVEIERNAVDYTRWTLEAWRHDLGLRQADIEGMSERHVRRIEQGVSRLTAPAADYFARAFGVSLRAFLDELARRTRKTREMVEQEEEPVPAVVPEVMVLDLAA